MKDAVSVPPPEFPNFSVKQLMDSKTRLLASSGKEFTKPAGIFQNSAEVRKARKEAMGRLGLDFLDVAEDDDMDLDKELAAADEMDLDAEIKPETPKEEIGSSLGQETPVEVAKAGQPVERLRSSTPVPSEDDLAGLSARERNRLKRKRKPGNSAYVAPPPTNAGAKYNTTPAGTSSKCVDFISSNRVFVQDKLIHVLI